jgi:predicted DCC family thiol-disulfide oxidoreductase YuxK
VNEDCAVCRTEMAHFGRIAARQQRPLRITSINADPGALAAYGLSEHAIKRRLYARDGDGTLVSGIDAVLAVWRTLPRWRVLARVVARPGLHRIGDLVYEGILVPTIGAWGARRAAPPAVTRTDQHA